MSIFLVYPGVLVGRRGGIPCEGNGFPSLGVNYLATVLRQTGHKAIVEDIFSGEIRGNPWDIWSPSKRLEKQLAELKPHIVGISFLTPSRRESLLAARVVKRFDPNIRVVAGGPHATIMHGQLLANYPEIDVVVIGEAERTLCEVVEAFELKECLQDVKGVAFRNESSGSIVVNPPRPLIENLDVVPFPDYGEYLCSLPNKRMSIASVVTGRGCPYGQCNFCASQSVWPGYRYRSVKNVVDEVEIVVKEYGVENIHIHDDTFPSPAERAVCICKEVVKKRIEVILDCKATLNSATRDFLYWYRKAGGRSIFFGLESGSQKVRELMGKPRVSNKQVEFMVRMLREAGIKVGIFVMFGYPGETSRDVQATCQMLKRLNPDRVRCTLTKVYPGTRLYQYAKQHKMLTDGYWLSEARRHRYFSFASDDEVAEIRKLDLLLREEFRGLDIWSEYDEQDIPYADESGTKHDALGEQYVEEMKTSGRFNSTTYKRGKRAGTQVSLGSASLYIHPQRHQSCQLPCTSSRSPQKSS